MGDSEKPEKDLLAFVGGPGPDGSRIGVRRSGGIVEFGRLIPMKEGEPMPPVEVLKVSPPSDGPWCEVETVYDGRPGKGGRPAMVNSHDFKVGWDAVFGGDKSKLN